MNLADLLSGVVSDEYQTFQLRPNTNVEQREDKYQLIRKSKIAFDELEQLSSTVTSIMEGDNIDDSILDCDTLLVAMDTYKTTKMRVEHYIETLNKVISGLDIVDGNENEIATGILDNLFTDDSLRNLIKHYIKDNIKRNIPYTTEELVDKQKSLIAINEKFENVYPIIMCDICIKDEKSTALRCGHTFCVKCVDKFYRSDIVTCPVCKFNTHRQEVLRIYL